MIAQSSCSGIDVLPLRESGMDHKKMENLLSSSQAFQKMGVLLPIHHSGKIRLVDLQTRASKWEALVA